jgi:hypothetical protein
MSEKKQAKKKPPAKKKPAPAKPKPEIPIAHLCNEQDPRLYEPPPSSGEAPGEAAGLGAMQEGMDRTALLQEALVAARSFSNLATTLLRLPEAGRFESPIAKVVVLKAKEVERWLGAFIDKGVK